MKVDRITVEDTLKQLHALLSDNEYVTVDALALRIQRSVDSTYQILSELVRVKLIRQKGSGWELTEEGRSYALEVLRAHRLYETYLAEQTSEAPEAWHKRAEVEEHKLSSEDVDTLATRLRHPRFDPHGDPIPTKSGVLPEYAFVTLAQCAPGMLGVITHIEDEPHEPYERLVRLKLAPGMRVRYTAYNDGLYTISCAGRVYDLDLAMAKALCVERLDSVDDSEEAVCRLSDLKSGEVAELVSLSPACVGMERRRLLDMGMVRGSRIQLELSGVFRSPVAYRVRNSVVALREEQSDNIIIRKVEQNNE
jgi:DtxR family Mn-dependent transcriptional regulator